MSSPKFPLWFPSPFGRWVRGDGGGEVGGGGILDKAIWNSTQFLHLLLVPRRTFGARDNPQSSSGCGAAPISAETNKLADKIKAGEPVPAISTTPQLSAARPGGQLCLTRETELAQLAATFQESTAGHGQTIFVRGRAGSGKSTLLKSFIGRALGKRLDLLVAWREGSNLSATFALPLQPFRDILENLSGEFSAHRSSGIFVPEYAAGPMRRTCFHHRAAGLPGIPGFG